MTYQLINYFQHITAPNGKTLARKIAVLDGKTAFYQSSGTNSGEKMQGTWYPFLGFETYGPRCGWFRKPCGISELNGISDELLSVITKYNPLLLTNKNTLPEYLERFSTVKCLILSSIIDESLAVSTSTPSALSEPNSDVVTTFWQTETGLSLKKHLKTLYPEHFKDRFYQFIDSNLVIDLRNMDVFSFEYQSALALANSVLEEKTNKSFVFNFDPTKFREDLLRFDTTTDYSQKIRLFAKTPITKIKLPVIKKAKKLISKFPVATELKEELERTQDDVSFTKVYTEFRWPKDLEELFNDGINSEAIQSRLQETEHFLRISIQKSEWDFNIEHQKLLNGEEPVFKAEFKNTSIMDEENKTRYTCYLDFTFLHNGQIIAYPTNPLPIANKNSRYPVQRVYNLSTGKWVVLKAFNVNNHPPRLLELSAKTGITKIYDYALGVFRQPNNNIFFEKKSIIEKFYSETFPTFMKTNEQHLEISKKMTYMLNLAQGLAAIHAKRIPFRGHSRKPDNTPFIIPCFHGDIKPDNIIYDVKKDQMRITDFDRFGEWSELTSSTGYFSPEFALGFMSSQAGVKINYLNFNARYGQTSDLWNLGTVFAIILGGSTPNAHFNDCQFPKLYFIHNRLKTSNQVKNYYLEMGELKQKEIDAEMATILDGIQDSPDQEILFQLWSVVVSLLKTDPDKRTKASDLVVQLETIIANYQTSLETLPTLTL